ncbi:hypothetical protein BP00DRAFT_110194 [Aspergillus indologenus CBS 114.80]|uniref:Uncharacterized protein n=1 Tax=Aspergillus indologenus CBS 114.80 TaxID=1450541 RepID=A0A2V5JCB8_9EURO|nr:hypothetical protein BP00DRAFT_110194 [Aspergillus indologenus CBS 114.80]
MTLRFRLVYVSMSWTKAVSVSQVTFRLNRFHSYAKLHVGKDIWGGSGRRVTGPVTLTHPACAGVPDSWRRWHLV